jgi:hypothetical protein
MAKKLLSEAQMRRFATLANLPAVNETYYKRDEEEDKMEETMTTEEEVVTEEEAPMDMPEAEPMDMPEEEPVGEDDLELTDEEAQAIIDLGKKLAAAMPDGAGEEPMDMPDDKPMDLDMPDDKMDDEDEIMEALSEINYVPEKKDIVEEVARRVAKRLLKAKRAKNSLDEALGNKQKK